MAKNKGSVPVSGYPTKEPPRIPKSCKYCGEEIPDFSHAHDVHPRECCDCYEMFGMKTGFLPWGDVVPEEIIRRADLVAERHPEWSKKVKQWRLQIEPPSHE